MPALSKACFLKSQVMVIPYEVLSKIYDVIWKKKLS